jgi:type II secretory pathway pseudopilin PulG
MINKAHHKFPHRSAPGMTLTEVMVALFILSCSISGILAVQLQSRRLTEGSVYQNTALTIVQGYLEQMKNMNMNQLYPTPTVGISALFNDSTTDYIQCCTGAVPALNTITPGVTPGGAGIVDNLRGFDMTKDPKATTETSTDTTNGATTAQVAWTTVWPKAIGYATAASNGVPGSTTGNNDLHLNLWVWVQDLSNSTTTNAKQVYGITIIYTWQYLDGGRTRYAIGSVRNIRSIVPSF